MRLWDVNGRRFTDISIVDVAGSINSLGFSPDGKILGAAGCGEFESDAPGCVKGELSLWDVATGQPLQATPKASRDEILSIAFSSDGILAWGSDFGAITLWEMFPALWRVRACYIANRNLTRAEWAQYFDRDPVTYDTVYAKNPTCPDLPLEPVATPTPKP